MAENYNCTKKLGSLEFSNTALNNSNNKQTNKQQQQQQRIWNSNSPKGILRPVNLRMHDSSKTHMSWLLAHQVSRLQPYLAEKSNILIYSREPETPKSFLNLWSYTIHTSETLVSS